MSDQETPSEAVPSEAVPSEVAPFERTDFETEYAVACLNQYEEKLGRDAIFANELEEFLAELNHRAMGHLHENNTTEEAASLLAHFICTTGAYDWLNALDEQPEVIDEDAVRERTLNVRAEVLDYLQFLLSLSQSDAAMVALVESIPEDDLVEEAIASAVEALTPVRKQLSKPEKKDKKKKRKAQAKARKKSRK